MVAQADPAQSEPIFEISRIFDAPRELVFQTWIDPRHVANWWGPKPFTAPVCEMDVRPGGAYRIVMRSSEGAEYPVSGVFVEIVKPSRIVSILDCREHPAAWHDMVKPNRAAADTNPAGILLQTVTLDDLDGRTRVTIRVRFESTEIRDAMVKMGMNEGWSLSLVKMAELLDELSGRMADVLKDSVQPGDLNESVTVRVNRSFDLSADQLFDAWLNLGDWMFTTPTGKLLRRDVDPRLGGRFVVIEDRGDHVAEHYGTFVVLERPSKLAFTFRTNFSLDSTLVTIEITPTESGCRLALTHVLDPKWAAFVSKAQTGWTKTLENLDRSLLRDREILTTGLFDAPRERVFAAWTKPDQVVHWWGPDGFTTTITEMDVRPQGAWRLTLHGPDGVDYPNQSEYLEVVPPERIVFQHGKPVFRSTITFEESEGKTTVTMRMLFVSAEERDRVARVFGAVEGGRQSFERLAAFLAAK